MILMAIGRHVICSTEINKSTSSLLDCETFILSELGGLLDVLVLGKSRMGTGKAKQHQREITAYKLIHGTGLYDRKYYVYDDHVRLKVRGNPLRSVLLDRRC